MFSSIFFLLIIEKKSRNVYCLKSAETQPILECFCFSSSDNIIEIQRYLERKYNDTKFRTLQLNDITILATYVETSVLKAQHERIVNLSGTLYGYLI